MDTNDGRVDRAYGVPNGTGHFEHAIALLWGMADIHNRDVIVPRSATAVSGEVIERNEAALEFLVAHEQLAKAVEPAMADLEHPATRFLFRIALLDFDLGPPPNDMRNIAVILDGAKVLCTAVACLGTQMLVPSKRRILRLTTVAASTSSSRLQS